MSERYFVRVTKDYLVFASAHFISYGPDDCEPLHGHNYRIALEVEGPLDDQHLVFDFVALKRMGREIVNELDHHVLLPTEHPFIRVSSDDREVTVTTPQHRYILPRSDCILLGIENTTVERLAWWIAGQLRERIAQQSKARPTRVRVEVEETFGQWGHYEWTGKS